LKFEKKYTIPLVIAFCLALGFVSATILGRYNYFTESPVNIFEDTRNECPGIKWAQAVDSTQKTSAVRIEGDLFFCGERVPLEDPDVMERLDRELQLNVFWHSNTLMNMKLANRYFGDIEKMLKENGTPTDFKYLALIESGFRYDVSSAGAAGFWQFVKGTAKAHNMQVDDVVDERYNYEKATIAACAYLKDAKEKLGSWTLAAASYNLGVPGMMSRVNDQKTNNYYEMYFNPETSRYIFRILALKIVFSNPENAGFDIKPKELYQPYKYKMVEVDTSIASIADFAAQFNLKYKHIKILNPWLRDAHLPNRERKKYQLKIMDIREN